MTHTLNSRAQKTGSQNSGGHNDQIEENFDHNYPWSWSAGDPSFFQISLNSNLTVYADEDFLFTAADGSNIATVQDLMGVQWGPQAPPTMG